MLHLSTVAELERTKKQPMPWPHLKATAPAQKRGRLMTSLKVGKNPLKADCGFEANKR